MMNHERRAVAMIGVVGAAATMMLLVGGCSRSQKTEVAKEPVQPAPPATPTVAVRMTTSLGEIVVELDPAAAPVTVGNFLSYVDKHEVGGYDGTIVHRVVPGFVVQGGGYSADFKERPSGPPIVNEWQNGLKNGRGTIAMARDTQPDTATREFYFNLVDNAKLDSAREKSGNAGYAVFGRVISGMEVVDRMGLARTAPRPDPKVTDGSFDNVPVEAIVIRKVERVGG